MTTWKLHGGCTCQPLLAYQRYLCCKDLDLSAIGMCAARLHSRIRCAVLCFLAARLPLSYLEVLPPRHQLLIFLCGKVALWLFRWPLYTALLLVIVMLHMWEIYVREVHIWGICCTCVKILSSLPQ
jgi:hypothetical protein